jgi:heavy metal translocating P-type ATPase
VILRRSVAWNADAAVFPVAAAAVAGTALGGVFAATDHRAAADIAWAATTLALLAPLTASVVVALAHRRLGVDLIALISMSAALAVGQYLAAAVVAVMLSGGNGLEAYARRTSRRSLAGLVERAPVEARIRRGDSLVTVPVDAIAVGDHVIVRGGEVVPVDGRLVSEAATIDAAALTGEPIPVEAIRGEEVSSGAANAGPPFELRALRPASQSVYAGVVRLVRQAEASRAPFVRMADRYAAAFLPFTLAVAGLAWALSGDPVRAVAVLVIATPCPLILAAPVAFVAGVSRAARSGIIVKGADVLERLGRVRTVLIDKTGTVTQGAPVLVAVDGADDPREALRLAATVDQGSTHVVARSIVESALARGLRLDPVTGVEEHPGAGVSATVAGTRVSVGGHEFMAAQGVGVPDGGDDPPGMMRVYVAANGAVTGSLVMRDTLRADARGLGDRLRRAGVTRVILATGDRSAVGAPVGELIGADAIAAELSPAGKAYLVEELRAHPDARPVAMVGDGVNDAPALARADVGVALGSATLTIASNTADAVITGERIGRIVDAVSIGRRSLAIARQSVLAGLGLSVAGMAVAAVGALPPVWGALTQELIDVAVILNALRALGSGPMEPADFPQQMRRPFPAGFGDRPDAGPPVVEDPEPIDGVNITEGDLR